MGWFRHHAIVVTGDKIIHEAWEKAKSLGLLVTDIVCAEASCFCTFCVVPDGWKELNDDSDRYDEAREKFVEYLIQHPKHWDMEWAEITYGDELEGGRAKLIRDSRLAIVWQVHGEVPDNMDEIDGTR